MRAKYHEHRPDRRIVPMRSFLSLVLLGTLRAKRRRKSKESLPIIGSRSREGVVEEPYCPLGHAKSTQKTMWPVWIVLDLSGQHSFPPICPRGSCVLHDLCAARRTERGPSRHLRLHSNGVSVVIVVSVVHTKLKAVNRAILP